MLVHEFAETVRRSDPKGLTVYFDAESTAGRIVAIEIDLIGDGEPSLPEYYPDEARRSGEYHRVGGIKPTVNGTWPLLVIATDSKGNHSTTVCSPGVTVIF